MAAANPYQSPAAHVADRGADTYSQVKIFSVSGRIGRARYIAYTMGLSFVLMFAIGMLGGALGAAGAEGLAKILVGAGYVALVVISIMLTVQRAHDFNTTGWIALVALIPLVALIFWFIPGTDGENRFGAKTPPNGTLTIIAAVIVPFIAIAGILAAIAIPAYQSYVKASQSAVK